MHMSLPQLPEGQTPSGEGKQLLCPMIHAKDNVIAIGSLYLWKDSVVIDQKTCQLLSRFSSLPPVSGRTMPAAVTRWPTASVYEAAPPPQGPFYLLRRQFSCWLEMIEWVTAGPLLL